MSDTTTREQRRDGPRSLAASGRKPPRFDPGWADRLRREQADRAIARIEDAYRRGLRIPDVR